MNASPWLHPRIWRCPDSDFYGDEPLNAANVYTDKVFEGIKSHGFDAIWMRGRLYDLMRSTILPELNQTDTQRRLDSLQMVIDRGRRAGVGVYLFFNEPLALHRDSEFWKSHPELRGLGRYDGTFHYDVNSLCTSTPLVMDFMREATRDVLGRLSGLDGIILITATEYQTHCYAHYPLRNMNGAIAPQNRDNLGCPRCKLREPADIVLDLLRVWTESALQSPSKPRVIAWNWSWSMWYDDPQSEIIDRLPQGAEMLIDWERGGTRPWRDRTIHIDEYSIGYVGPSERFTGTQQAVAKRGVPVHAKLQIGTTHELATVPNLPLITNLHEKWTRLYRRDIRGVMGTWNFGCGLTLNSFAFGLFASDPKRFLDREIFLGELCRQYFGITDHAAVAKSWEQFSKAFELYPFSMAMIYFSPMNYAPAYPLSSDYRGAPMMPTWEMHPWGDRLEDCLGPFTIDEVIGAFAEMAQLWNNALPEYERGLSVAGGNRDQLRHRGEEVRCARMIGLHLRSTANIFRFHRARTRPEENKRELIADELDVARAALTLLNVDSRLGFHQECQARMCDPAKVQEKIALLELELSKPD